MRRLRPSASALALVLLSFVAASLPRDARYAHRHDGDTHGHVHVGDGAHGRRSSLSVHDLARQHHEHPHDHDHGHDSEHGLSHVYGHDHGHAPGPAHHAVAKRATAEHHGGVARAHDHARDASAPHRHDDDDDDDDAAARGTTRGPAYSAPGEPLHEHWQDPFHPAATTAPSRVLVVALVVERAGVAPVAAPVERARALRARGPPLSLA